MKTQTITRTQFEELAFQKRKKQCMIKKIHSIVLWLSSAEEPSLLNQIIESSPFLQFGERFESQPNSYTTEYTQTRMAKRR